MRKAAFVIPLAASLALASCGKGADTPNPSAIDIPSIVTRAQQLAAKGCLVRPFAESIGPIIANAIDVALLAGAPIAITIEALAHQAADAFCAIVQAQPAPQIGARRGAAAGPVNYGTVNIGGRPVAIIGTPL